MRNNFLKELVQAATKDPDIYLLCGDLGFSVLEPFAEQFPERFINVGIAEQNMIGVATGLALSGKKVFAYSIVNFAIARCLEQIRNDMCYHDANVTIVAVGGGVPYGTHGYSHQGVEDVALTRCLPGMNVYSPADAFELSFCMSKIIHRNGPHYLRLARGGEPPLYDQAITSPSVLIELRPKQDINIIAMGTPLSEALEAHHKLEQTGLRTGLFSLPHLSNEVQNEVCDLARDTSYLITLEEHLTQGGLGSFICEIVSSLPAHARVMRRGLAHKNLKKSGGQSFLRKQNGINCDALVELISGLSGGCA